MMNESIDVFTVPELYLLAAAFDGNVLFGLPEKQIYQIQGEEVFADAHQRLIEKGILSSDGKITKGGAIIIRAIELYHQSGIFVRINNLMFAFQGKEEDEVIVLVELAEQREYQLRVISKAIVLQMLNSNFPLIGREPDDREKTFLKEELSYQERLETEVFEPESMFMNLEIFRLKRDPKDLNFLHNHQQWLIFMKGEKLIMVDTVYKKYYQASQYWFLKVLFDALDFPYKEAKSNA